VGERAAGSPAADDEHVGRNPGGSRLVHYSEQSSGPRTSLGPRAEMSRGRLDYSIQPKVRVTAFFQSA